MYTYVLLTLYELDIFKRKIPRCICSVWDLLDKQTL